MMLIVSIILIVISIVLIIYSFFSLKRVHIINQDIDKQNEILIKKYNQLCTETKYQEAVLEEQERKVSDSQKQLTNIQNNISVTLENQKKLTQDAFKSYCETLENKYKEEEEEYEQYKDALQTAYSNLQLKLMQESNEVKADLDKIKETRTAAIEALNREKEISEQLSFYCLQVSDNDLKDIAVLEAVKPKLINQRILSMLIWQTYWRTPMTNLCNNIIGKEVQIGIYKITNQKTKECYIGQSVDLASRWKDHAKCGLGIDPPAGNKLYKAMQEFGIWNFSWEILELCPREQLDEKEKYYIDLYDSKNFGYNSTKGNK